MKRSKADLAWANAVKERDEWTCRRCGQVYVPGSRGIQACHIFTRSRRSTRHDLFNGLALCTACHFWQHRNPYEAREFFEQLLGASFVAELEQRSCVLKRAADAGAA